MKAAKDGNIKGRNETRLALWEGHLKDSVVALDKAPIVWKFSIEADCWLQAFEASRLQ